MLLVVAYDIPDDRRRVKLHTLLSGYGEGVQESVFECAVTDKQAQVMKRRVARLIRPAEDKVRYYALCVECAARIEEGDGASRPKEPVVYVV